MDTKIDNVKPTAEESANDNENKSFIKNEFTNIKNNIMKNKNKKIIFILIIIISSIIVLLLLRQINSKIKKNESEKIVILPENISSQINASNIVKNNLTKFNSSKWIVMTTINSPKRNLNKLLKAPSPWKIVVIGDNKTNNSEWQKFKNSTNLIYLSIEDQLKLGYNITKFIPLNSYTRKNIGYLYAIQNGANEIYDIDDNIKLVNKFFLNIYVNKYTIYAENNNSVMVNPYNYFGKPSMWPRGYRLKDIEKKFENKFYRLFSSRANLNHLIYQGLLNVEPDVDSIYSQTRIIKKKSVKQRFTYIGNLMYLPGNFVPINSKNTRYLYDIFPSLALPITVPKKVSDIWRGYIMQRYAWIYNGTVIFQHACAEHKRNHHKNNLNFIEEKDLYYKLDDILNALNIDVDNNIKHPSEFLIKLIEILVEKGILGEKDLDMYNAFIQDLNSFGYNYNLVFNHKIEKNEKELLNFYSELKFYQARERKDFLQNNNKAIKLFNHKSTKEKYENILLIINYNYEFLTKLNDYMLKLYHEYFPNLIFVYPEFIEDNQTYVSCPESHRGYYSYKCVKKVYEKYPNYKGYLFLMDDNFLKVWELENLDFSIPWFYHFFVRNSEFQRLSYLRAKKVLDIRLDWRRNYTKYLGSYIVAYAVSDIYYLPKEDIGRFCEMVDFFYERRVFLESAVPTIMGIMLKPKYQIIHFCGLWNDRRNRVVRYLKNADKQVTIHPIKFSNLTLQNEVNKYIYIVNANEY